MGYRGRLIFPFLARLSRLDTTATAADPDAAGPLTSGFDPVFREPRLVPASGTQVGTDPRVYMAPIDLPCQVEDEVWAMLTQMRTGDSPRTEVTLVFHFADLEAGGYVDAATGQALVPCRGDRLDSIHIHPTGEIEASVPAPGLYVTHSQPRSFGLGGKRKNLLVVTFRNRDTSMRA